MILVGQFSVNIFMGYVKLACLDFREDKLSLLQGRAKNKTLPSLNERSRIVQEEPQNLVFRHYLLKVWRKYNSGRILLGAQLRFS